MKNKHFLTLIAVFSINFAQAAPPSDLLYLGKPIDPLCFFNLENNKNLIHLNECGLAKEKFVKKEPDADLIKKGYIGFNWEDRGDTYVAQGYSYYKFFDAGNKQFWIYTLNGSGGSGEFTAIHLVKRQNKDTLEIKTLTGGDRCNGGVQDVSLENKHLNFSINLTPFDLFALANQNPHQLKAYDDLAACAACCSGKAFYEINSDLKLNFKYVDLGNEKNPTEMPTQGKYESCFNDLFARYVSQNKNKLDDATLKKFVNEFNSACVK